MTDKQENDFTMSHINFNQLDPAIEKRVTDLMAQMTLDEKIGQMSQLFLGKEVTPTIDLSRIREGRAGSVLTMYGAADLNVLQKAAVEESRLGIPLLFGNDVIHGYRTIFPIPLAEACSWDMDLIEESARIASEEAAADGTHWIFAPMVDTCREPRWGRIAEGSGEDPFLGSEIGRARVRGFQSDSHASGKKVVSCPKHFAAYGFSEAGKDYNSVDISEQTLRDMVLPPFQATFDEGAGTIMSAFNDLNGVPATGNRRLLRTILRDEMGFNGIVLSDWNAIGELVPHGFAADNRHAGLRAIHAGVDMDMTTDAYEDYLADQIANGEVPVEYVDDAVRRILRIKFMLGLFEDPYTVERDHSDIFLTPAYRETALEMTRKSMVLLKNEGVLPLAKTTTKIALIGPLANDHHEILGTWFRIGEDGDTESVLDGLRQVVPDAEIALAEGCHLYEDSENVVAAATIAAEADVAILVLGEGEFMSGEAHCRADISLPGHQQLLLEAVHATGTPVVVVLMGGRPITIPWMDDNVPAILMAWHGGIRTGRAVADLLFGNATPSGKLPVSWPRSVGQIPIYYNYKNTGRPSDGDGTYQFNKVHYSNYQDESNAPQYPFGYGLSYTQFSYSELVIENARPSLNETLTVRVTITNTGDVAGDEIAQLYVRDLVGEVTRPVRELKGFQTVSLAPGASETIQFEVPVQSLGFTGIDGTYLVEPGQFDLWVGGDSSAALKSSFEVTA